MSADLGIGLRLVAFDGFEVTPEIPDISGMDNAQRACTQTRKGVSSTTPARARTHAHICTHITWTQAHAHMDTHGTYLYVGLLHAPSLSPCVSQNIMPPMSGCAACSCRMMPTVCAALALDPVPLQSEMHIPKTTLDPSPW